MRKSVIVLVLVAFSVQNPKPVEAGAFATEVTQLLNHAQLVLQYIRQGEQLANEINMYADMLKNSRTLSAHSFGAIMNDINGLAAIVQGGRALAYSLGNLDQVFRQTYPGYQLQRRCLLHAVPKLVADFARYDTRDASRRGIAGPAASE